MSSGYICEFSDLQIKSVLLDEIMAEPEEPALDNVLHMEVKVSECQGQSNICFPLTSIYRFVCCIDIYMTFI